MFNTRDMDMLHGSFWDKIIIFALPLALTGVLQQLFNAADVAILGQFVGKNAMAAVGNNIAVIGILVNLFMGLSLGANVVIARFIGAKKPERVGTAVQTAFALSLIMGFILLIFGETMSTHIIKWLAVPAEVEDMAETYLRVYLLGLPFIGVYNFEAAILRARGDTRTPLKALAVASCVNIALDLLFVGWGWSVAGVAIATIIAMGVSAAILFWALTHAQGIVRLQFTNFTFDRGLLREIAAIGLPAGIQGMVFSLSNILIQAALNSLGPDAMAASAAAFTIEINSYCVLNAFAQATTTFVSQNYGAGNMPRCFKITKVGLGLDIGFTIAMGVFIILFANELLGIFSNDMSVLELGKIRLWHIVMPQFIEAIIDVLSGALRGYGFSLPPALIALFGICAVRIVWLYTVFAAERTYEMLMLCYPISWAVTAFFIALFYNYSRKHIKMIRV